MLLGHGTSFAHIDAIRKNGIKPRGTVPSLWDRVPSASDRVYLSNAYAFYFAQNAAKEDEDLLVMEVDVDEKNLLPDEDFLGHITGGDHQIAEFYPDLDKRTIFLRDWIVDQPKKKRLELAKESLEYLGNAAYKGIIAPDKIKRYARIPHKEVGGIIFREFDPIIAPINYRFMGEQYRAFQESLFDRFPYEG